MPVAATPNVTAHAADPAIHRRIGRRLALSGVAAALLSGCGNPDFAFDGRRFAAAGDSRYTPPEPGRQVGPVELTSHDGRRFDAASLGGRWSLVYFGYTACPDSCPTSLATVAHALDLMGPQAGAVVPLFVSFDTDRDGPESLRLYVRQFHPALVGLTGTPREVQSVARRFGARAWRVPSSDPALYKLDHTSLVYLVDPAGRLSASFWPQQPPEQVAAVARQGIGSA